MQDRGERTIAAQARRSAAHRANNHAHLSLRHQSTLQGFIEMKVRKAGPRAARVEINARIQRGGGRRGQVFGVVVIAVNVADSAAVAARGG